MKKIWTLIKKNVVFVMLLLFLIGFNLLSTGYSVYIMDRALTNAVAVVGLMVLYGMTGQITLAQMIYMGLAAYVTAICQMQLGIDSILSMGIGVVFATLWGCILGIPSFKLSGPFLTISTCAFGEIVKGVLTNLVSITNGPSGINEIPDISVFGHAITSDKAWYFIALAMLFFISIGANRLKNSQIGRAMYAVNDDELAASLMGVNVKRTKLLAFTVSAFCAGVAGAMYAHLAGYIVPSDFAQQYSANLFTMAVIGGGDAVAGAWISSTAMTVLPELLRFLQEYYILVLNAIVLIYLITPWRAIREGMMHLFAHRDKRKGAAS